MALLKIYNCLEPVLRKKAALVENIDGRLVELTQSMTETMFDAPGAGLAANQIGEPISLFVVDMGIQTDKRDPIVVVNPIISASEDQVLDEEGCLSIPEVFAKVWRSNKVELKGYSLDQKEIRYEAEGYLARAIQHEMDHLDGKLFWDNLGKAKRDLLKTRFKKKLKEMKA
ncbi:MAG: peptide deformylase [Nitrospinae bacterium CG11_big_fil_rev_8_21_14_0_20_56_8]|nr:MAG: peptide deformylase [Nitrospinae bacterium CG11_big_fil_rev_8_21_14_0_20_56_8]